MRNAPAFIAVLLCACLQACYTRLYREEARTRAEPDSLAYGMDAVDSDTAYAGDTMIIDRYYSPGEYRGYPYREWDDPFYDRRPLLHGYWEYYYDPYWDYRWPYRLYHPYEPYYPHRRYRGSRPHRSPSRDGEPQGNGEPPGKDLYPPPTRTPPPEKGRRRRDSGGTESGSPDAGSAQGDERQTPSAAPKPSASPPPAEIPSDSGSGDRGIPRPERGRRR